MMTSRSGSNFNCVGFGEWVDENFMSLFERRWTECRLPSYDWAFFEFNFVPCKSEQPHGRENERTPHPIEISTRICCFSANRRRKMFSQLNDNEQMPLNPILSPHEKLRTEAKENMLRSNCIRKRNWIWIFPCAAT